MFLIKEIRNIVKELECLPLAVDQAAAYIAALQLPITHYLPRYRKQFAKIAGHKPRGRRNYKESVLTTWETSFAAVQQENPEAAELLTMCSFLNNEDIWEDMLLKATGLQDNGLYFSSVGRPCTDLLCHWQNEGWRRCSWCCSLTHLQSVREILKASGYIVLYTVGQVNVCHH
jgi:hypothetical protein